MTRRSPHKEVVRRIRLASRTGADLVGKQPRRHHYVPQFYLAGFTESDNADGDLFVVDKERLRTWKSTPKGTAHKRDFHAIDSGPQSDPMEIEKKLAVVEGQWNMALKSIIKSETLPEDGSFGDLMMFVAFMAVRVLRIRSVISDAIDRVSKTEIQTMLATDEGRARFRETFEELGDTLADEEFEAFVQFGISGQYEVDYEQTWHVIEMLRMGITLAPLLSLRKWALWKAKVDAPDLICSDNPVAPTWAVPPPTGLLSPAFGTPKTIVSVPLNRRLALVGMLEEELPASDMDRNGVAAVNSMTAMYANQLFSPAPDFVWTMKDHSVGDLDDLLAALKVDEK